jgi:CHAT domain-containing protein
MIGDRLFSRPAPAAGVRHRRSAVVVPIAAIALALSVAGPPSAAAQGFKNVGDERDIGANRTGEPCRLRLMQIQPENANERFALYCEGWTQPSGEIRRFRAPRGYAAEKLLTDSLFQKAFETRVGDCGPVEPTALASGAPAVLRECKRINGGWRVLVLGAVIGQTGYGLETFPTNLPLLELALELLEGRRRADRLGTAPVSAAIRRAETMVGASGALVGVQDIGAHAALFRLGELQNWSAHYPDSEATFRRVLELEERLIGRDAPQSGVTLAWIALNIGNQQRFAESDQIYARAETLTKRSFAADDQPRYLTFRALTESRRGDGEQSLRYAEEAVRGRATRGDSPGMAHSLAAMVMAQNSLKRYDEAEQTANRALAILEKPGGNAEFRLWWWGETYHHLGWAHVGQKRYADARKAFDSGLERRRLLLGDSVRVTDSLLALGQLGRLEGNLTAALSAYRQAAEIQVKDRPARERARADNIVGYLDALIDAAQASPTDRDALLAEAFAAAQIPRGSDTARAVNNMAARLDASDPAIRAAAREYQEAARQRDRLRQALAVETIGPADKRDPAREESLKRDFRAAEEKVAALEGRLQAELPRYAQLTAPRPMPVSELAQILRPGEALLAFLPTRRATYVFLVRDGRARVQRAPIGADDLARVVSQVRASLEPADGQLKPFDVAAAHRLYSLLLAPVADGMQGVTHLIEVPAGPMLSLPLGLLVTRSTTAGADDAQTPWLARVVAISVLPATASLKELRQVAGRSTAPQPFIGFGDPSFAGAAGDTRSFTAIAKLCRQGDPVDANLVRGLPRLRETARELTLIARSLGADPGSVVLGADANEAKVRGTDLSQYRVITFATHGLLPGELKCKSEPALALTPPATSSAADDGLLDASEVAQLKLDADWVVLSACNTAGPDGKLGGESLSGLARAFFYAGARALLVSHWAVASLATVALTTSTFDAQAKDQTLGRAEALRRAQLALAGDRDTVHPFYWAPFVLVGDGGQSLKP